MSDIDFSKVAALTSIFVSIYEQFGKEVAAKVYRSAWESVVWKEQALAYHQKVQRLYGTTQLFGQTHSVDLDKIYTAINVLDRPTAWERYSQEAAVIMLSQRDGGHFASSPKEKRRDGVDLVKKGKNLFILGQPGAGKTTFLKHLALQAVKGNLAKGDLASVPIFVELRKLPPSHLSLFKFIVNEFEICDFPNADKFLEEMLKSGKALLLFDGLDEVNRDERAELIDSILEFTKKYDKCQRIVTCRIAANDYFFEGYEYVEMADLNDGQIREFVAKRFSGDSQQRGQRERFLAELSKRENKGLRELSRVPLLLAMLCLVFEGIETLSSQRAKLYEQALERLLEKWDEDRQIKRDEAYRDLTVSLKKKLLAQVAYQTFDWKDPIIPRKTLTHSFEAFLQRISRTPEEGDGEIILRSIISQHGLMVEQWYDYYSFAHLTFHEYFTAHYIAENQKEGTLPPLMEHYDDARYREVLLLTAAQLKDTKEFFNLFLERLVRKGMERPTVATMLRQVHSVAAAADSGLNLGAIQSLYLYLILDRYRVRDRVLDRSGPVRIDLLYAPHFEAHDRSRPLDRALSSTLALASSIDNLLNVEQALGRSSSITWRWTGEARAQKRISVRAHDYGCSPYKRVARDFALLDCQLVVDALMASSERSEQEDWLSRLKEFLQSAADQSGQICDAVTEGRVRGLYARLSNPNFRTDADTLEKLKDDLDGILRTQNLLFPCLGEDDQKVLTSYLTSNLVFLECIGQAIVVDPDEIRKRLLLLPGV